MRLAAGAVFTSQSTRGRLEPSLALACALCALLFALTPALEIGFGLIDDHEIKDILGSRSRLPLWEVPWVALERTDEPYGRFRPGYWFGRALEASIAGDSAWLWYVNRILLAAAALVAIFVVLIRFVEPMVAGPLSLVPFLGPASEVWTRLGPNEAYALPLLLWGLALLVRGAHIGAPPRAQWPGYCLLILAGLCKENFILLVPVLVAASVLHYGLRRSRRADWLTVGGSLLLAALGLATFLHRGSQYGSLYPQDRSVRSSLEWMHFVVASTLHAQLLLALLLAVITATVTRASHRRAVLAAVAVLTLSAATQVFAYAGAPQVGRYLHPLTLVPVVLWAMVAVAISARVPVHHRRTAASVLALILVVPLADAVLEVRQDAREKATDSRAFGAALEDLERAVSVSGADTVVLQPQEPKADLEATMSLARYLTADLGVEVSTLPATDVAADAYSRSLAATLSRWSHRGSPDLAPYVANSRCLSVVFGADQPVCRLSSVAPR